MQPDVHSIAVVLRISIGMLALFLAFRFLFVPTVVASFRQRIFEERRALFLFMADGGILPDNPAYVHLRSTMNGLLRQAENITFLRMLMAWRLYREQSKIYRDHFQIAIDAIEDNAKKDQLLKHREAVSLAVFSRILFTSPMAMFCAIVFCSVALLRALVLLITKGPSSSKHEKETMEARMFEPVASIEAEARLCVIEEPPMLAAA